MQVVMSIVPEMYDNFCQNFLKKIENFLVTCIHEIRKGGHSTLGNVPCATKKTLLFFARFHRKLRPPVLPTFIHWPPILTKSLSSKDPDTSLSLKDPSFLHLIVKQVTLLGGGKNGRIFSKISTNLTKCWEIFGIFWCISLKDPHFCALWVTERPLFLTLKDPYTWGAWWHLYVTFICECSPPPHEIYVL